MDGHTLVTARNANPCILSVKAAVSGGTGFFKNLGRRKTKEEQRLAHKVWWLLDFLEFLFGPWRKFDGVSQFERRLKFRLKWSFLGSAPSTMSVKHKGLQIWTLFQAKKSASRRRRKDSDEIYRSGFELVQFEERFGYGNPIQLLQTFSIWIWNVFFSRIISIYF